MWKSVKLSSYRFLLIAFLCLLPTLFLSTPVKGTPPVVTPENPLSENSKTKFSRDLYYPVEGPISGPRAPRLTSDDYPKVTASDNLGENRLVIWILAQQHAYWSGMVLGVLILVTFLEFRGLVNHSNEQTQKFDPLGYEILGLVLLALSLGAILGGIFLFGLIALYPDLTKYLFSVFRPIVLLYGVLLLLLTLSIYVYYYSWPRMISGVWKGIHACLGVCVNVIGTTILFLANAWSSFMLSPAGIDAQGRFLGNYWHVVHTALWNPFNLHRFAGNLVLAGAVIATYAGYRALTANTQKEKAHYDYMGYLAFLCLVFSLFAMPFGGYWLLREIYAYNQQMGITLLGGLLAWLGIVLVSLIGALFLGINYYLWQRISSAGVWERFGHQSKYIFFLLCICIAVYVTPHTMVMTGSELESMGGQQHQVIGNYGVESAKSTAVNIMMVATMWSFFLWRRTRYEGIVYRNRLYDPLVITFFFVAAANILWLGIYGYFIPANVRIGLSIPMVMSSLTVILLSLIFWHATGTQKQLGRSPWGDLSGRGYFTLFFLGFVVTWLVGLGGYRRSSLRLFWHIQDLVKDNSPWAFTPTIGFATNIITLNALIFWCGLLLLFWLGKGRKFQKSFAFPDKPKLSEISSSLVTRP